MFLQPSHGLAAAAPSRGPTSSGNGWFVGALSAIPITYYAATLSYRYYVLRQRHTLYLTYLADPTSPSSPYGSLEEAVKARYASLRCLFTRRFLNVTWEWREQGIWEWLFHQVVWKPLTGRVWWNGGYPAKASLQDVETADEAVLPVEPLDAARLLAGSRRGRGGAGTSTTTSSSGESESPTITSAHSGRSSADVSDDEHWEKLEVTESIQVDPTPDATGPSTTTSTKEAAASSGSSSSSSEATFTWIGQSTCLVQCDGITILTDPVFSDKPIETFLAPSRLRPPACPLQDLLAMDIVHVCFISHNHFDHLDIEVVRALRNTVRWVVPLGLRQFFLDNGVREDRIEELDWWEEREVTVGPPSSAVSSMTAAASEKEAPDTPQSPRSLTVFCTPAQHWSGRTPLDTNQSLWSGFIVKFPKSGKTFFHCGDTGYSEDLFHAVGQVYGPIDLAAIPIGSYQPRWFMRIVHTDPEGAAKIHRHLRITKTVGVHWGTWIISDERYDEPPKELERQLSLLEVERCSFVTLPIGRTISWE